VYRVECRVTGQAVKTHGAIGHAEAAHARAALIHQRLADSHHE
jgi:hypothetical protein